MPHQTRKTVILTLLVVMVMFGVSFALAPLYSALCRATGINGRGSLTPYVANQEIPDATRMITIQFVTTNNANLPWTFYPKKTSLQIQPGQNAKMEFFVKNNSQKNMTVQAIPSISPWQAVKYFHKIECFCFEKQTLAAGNSETMPVVFQLDKALPKDIQTITLSYTLFDVTK